MKIEQETLESNGYFGILEGPFDHKQHPNQQNGLDIYIKVLNFDSGEECCKKLYKNTKGYHFKHTGGSGSGTHYLKEFTEKVLYVPYQVIEVD